MPSSLGIVASGEDVLNDAVLWLDASLSSVSGGKLTNLGKGGSALDAQFGSTTSTDTNDPLLLTHTGTNYLYLPGTTGNYARTPDSNALDITGDLEFVCRIAAEDYTPSTDKIIAAKWRTNQWSWHLRILTSGAFSFFWSNAGTTALNQQVSPPVALVDGATYWVRAQFTVATRQLTVSWAPDQATEPVSYTSSASSATGAATTIFAGSAVLEVGSADDGVSLPWSGRIYRTIVRNGLGGTTVFDADFTAGITSGSQTTFTESSSNAATVTINRATSGRKSVAVTRNVLLFGTDDYLEVADNDLLDFGASESFTALVVFRPWATPATSAKLLCKREPGGTNIGWELRSEVSPGLGVIIDDGPNSALRLSLVSYTLGASNVASMVVDRSAQTLVARMGNTESATASTSTVGSILTSSTLRVGSISGGTSYMDMEFAAAAVFRRALTANEIATIVARYT